jgi:hypothetical protein
LPRPRLRAGAGGAPGGAPPTPVGRRRSPSRLEGVGEWVRSGSGVADTTRHDTTQHARKPNGRLRGQGPTRKPSRRHRNTVRSETCFIRTFVHPYIVDLRAWGSGEWSARPRHRQYGVGQRRHSTEGRSASREVTVVPYGHSLRTHVDRARSIPGGGAEVFAVGRGRGWRFASG